MKNQQTTKKQTQSKLADELGVSRQLIAAHIKHGGTPPLHDVAGWQAYLAEKGRIGSAPIELRKEIAEERLAILRASRAKLDRENQQAAGLLMPTADAIRQANAAGALFMGELQRLSRELPQCISGESAINIAIRLDVEIEKIRKELTEKLQEIGS